MSTLIVVPCGGMKIWSYSPIAAPQPAKEAYISTYFRHNREYAEAMSDRWVILSAEYGYIDPDEIIDKYDKTFAHKAHRASMLAKLIIQIREMGLDRYDKVLGMGGEHYRDMVEQSFAHHGLAERVQFPFARLSIGKQMQAIDQALDSLN